MGYREDINAALDRHDLEDKAVTAENVALRQANSDQAGIISTLRARLEPVVIYEKVAERRVKMPAGKRGGGAGANDYAKFAEKAEDITVTYDFMFEAGFDFLKGGKGPGPVAVLDGESPTLPTGGKVVGGRGCSGRWMWLTPLSGTFKSIVDKLLKRKAKAPAEAAGYPYHPGQLDGDGGFGDNIFTGFVPPTGEYFTVEMRFKMNTVGRSDGIYTLNFGGGRQVELTDWVWRTDPLLEWNYMLYAMFPGGGDDSYASKVDRYVRIKNVKVTTPAVAA